MGRAPALRAFQVHNFRLYFVGQFVSMLGTFMQAVAQAWIVLQMTGSATALGVVSACQFGPILLLGPVAGQLTDRFDTRRLYALTQSVSAAVAIAVGTLVATDSLRLWVLYALALVLGVVSAVDQVVRAVLLFAVVPQEMVHNATSLTMAVLNVSRAVGPAAAGLIIAQVGAASCFFINALTFAITVAALPLMRSADLVPPGAVADRADLGAGLRFVRNDPSALRIVVFALLFFGLAWELDIVIPLVATFVFDGDAGTIGLLTSAFGVGAIIGALANAHWAATSSQTVSWATISMAAAYVLLSVSPSAPVAALALVAAGAAGMTIIVVCNTQLQALAPHAIRGRVLALWAIIAVGPRPIAGPMLGALADWRGGRAVASVGAIGLLGLALPIWLTGDRGARDRRTTERGLVRRDDQLNPRNEETPSCPRP
jgi:MFS family permease